MSGGFGSSTQETRRITDLERQRRALEERVNALESSTTPVLAALGSVTLATGAATSTVKSDASVKTTSVILIVASSADGWSIDAGITGITSAAGSFTISHSASSLTRTFNYVVINPA